MRATLLITASLLLTTVACTQEEPSQPTLTASSQPTAQPTAQPSSPPASASPSPDRPTKVIDTVATGLEAPWGIAFLPDGSALVTERDSGRILQVRDGRTREVGTIRATRAQGEAGLLGIAVSPQYADNGRVFVYVTSDEDNRVLSMNFDGDRIGEPTAVFTGIPKGFIHDGGRLAFGPDGGLYVSTGETGETELAQDPDSLAGKILKITEEGEPFSGDDPVFSTGHRNVQGLAFDDRDRLWASEFGNQTWDELNRITQGKNYGWPRVEGRGDEPEFTNPAAVWSTDQASPSGLAFADGSLWMASLRGARLWQIPVTADGVGKPVAHFEGTYGRLRAVVRAPDGNLWLATSNRDGRGEVREGDDRILVVRP